MYKLHYEDVDKVLSTLDGKDVDQNLLEDLAKGGDYSNLIYDLEKLCNNLDKDTELVVLSEETKLTNALKSDADREQEQPDGN